MAGFLLGTKQKQSQTFDEKGQRIPVTSIESTPCYLIALKINSKNGYNSVKLGYGVAKTIKKSTQGEAKKVGIEKAVQHIKEIRIDRMLADVQIIEEEGKQGISVGEHKIFVGEQINPTFLFKKGDFIDVSGMSKGKGFQGVVKRHGFAGGPKTHGQSDRWRAPGSAGQGTTPGRTYKGKRSAGRMGYDKITVKNLQVVEVTESNLLVKGLVPGVKKGLLTLISYKK